MLLHLAWFGLGVLTTLTVVCLVMLEHMRRLDCDNPSVPPYVDQEVANALAAYDVIHLHNRLVAEQPSLASGIKGFDRAGRRLH